MDFKLDSEQQLLQDSVRRYIEKAYSFEQRRERMRKAAQGHAGHWQAFADNGWLAAALPEAYGGLGGSLIETAVVAQEFGRGLVTEPYLGCAVLAAQALVAGGTTDQLDHWLPSLANGTRRLALAYAEAPSRGMPLPVALRANPCAGGHLLSGRKTLVLGGAQADAFLVSAQMPQGLTLFCVDADAGGLARTRLPLHDGSEAAELVFDQVKVDAHAVVGQPGAGLAALQTGLAHGMVAICAELVGAMEMVIEMTAGFLKTRQQFGVPIGNFQTLQHRLADMAAEMEMARSMLFAALAAMQSEDEESRQKTLSGAKSLVCRAAKWVCGQGIQLHGGIGMTDEYAVGHYFKRAIVADLLLGSSDRHDATCAGLGPSPTTARQGLDAPREVTA